MDFSRDVFFVKIIIIWTIIFLVWQPRHGQDVGRGIPGPEHPSVHYARIRADNKRTTTLYWLAINTDLSYDEGGTAADRRTHIIELRLDFNILVLFYYIFYLSVFVRVDEHTTKNFFIPIPKFSNRIPFPIRHKSPTLVPSCSNPV